LFIKGLASEISDKVIVGANALWSFINWPLLPKAKTKIVFRKLFRNQKNNQFLVFKNFP